MAVALDQVATTLAGSSPTTLTLTWATLPTAGASAFVQVGLAGAGTITNVVDNGTTPRTFTRDLIDTTSGVVSLYRADNITLPGAGSYHVTITVTGAGSVEYHAGGGTFTGLSGGSPTSSTGAGNGTSLSVNTGNLTPANSGDLKVGGFADAGGTQTITLTTASAADVFKQPNGNTAFAGAMAYHVTTAATAQSLAWTISGITGPQWATVYALYAANAGTTANAGLASGTGKALQIPSNAGLASGTGTASQSPAPAGLAHGTGTAFQPNAFGGILVSAGLATGTGTASQMPAQAGLAHGTGTAFQIPAPAGLAHATGTSQQPKPLATATPPLVSAVATARQPVIQLIRNPLNLGAVLTENVPDGTLTLANPPGSGLGATLARLTPDATLALQDFDATAVGWTMLGPVPLTLSEFNDVTVNIAVTQNGSPYNLSGVTLNLLLKTKAGTPDASALIFSSACGSPAITITNAAQGLATATIPNTDLSAETYNFYRLDVVASGLTNTTLYGPIAWITL